MNQELIIKKESGTFKNSEGQVINYNRIRVIGFDGLINCNITDKGWVKQISDYQASHPDVKITIKGEL